MPDYVLYHNPERMTYTADSVGEDGFSIVTSKNLPSVIGNRVWLITGEGTPRTFKLFGNFRPDSGRMIDEPDFVWEFTDPESSGVKLRRSRWPVLNHEPWWREFQQRQSNFSLGLQAIDPRFVAGLEAVLERVFRYNVI